VHATYGPPTSGLGLGNSAGLCTLCHGKVVDNMDSKTDDTTTLWIGNNGHSNSALGGTADDTGISGSIKAANILRFSNASSPFVIQGRNPTELPLMFTTDYEHAGNPMMAYFNGNFTGDNRDEIDGFRSSYSGKGLLVDPRNLDDYAYQFWNWGVSQDDTTIDKGYHAFTCSKCHNPHASRLPKLMITNCLDTKWNTWDNGRTVQGTFPKGDVLSVDNDGNTLSNVGSAQNCHRLADPLDQAATGNGSGWNRVTPWFVAPTPP
ncbi:MAG: hypothetical protein OEU35_02905, partial [Desulfuromonadales bacterium]|nr:hypothetical protein [Desulfuromonadales bacterium]